MLKKILVVILLLIVAVGIFAATRSSDYRVERSMTMNAPAGRIYVQVNDLHAWSRWSPWEKIDPKAKVSYEGERAEKGAIMRWDGNDQVGAGSMTITETEPNKLVRLKLEFTRPMPGDAMSEITLAPEGDTTKVTWAMYGKRDFKGKLIGLFIDCDKMIGDKYEEGLTNLKAVVNG